MSTATLAAPPRKRLSGNAMLIGSTVQPEGISGKRDWLGAGAGSGVHRRDQRQDGMGTAGRGQITSIGFGQPGGSRATSSGPSAWSMSMHSASTRRSLFTAIQPQVIASSSGSGPAHGTDACVRMFCDAIGQATMLWTSRSH